MLVLLFWKGIRLQVGDKFREDGGFDLAFGGGGVDGVKSLLGGILVEVSEGTSFFSNDGDGRVRVDGVRARADEELGASRLGHDGHDTGSEGAEGGNVLWKDTDSAGSGWNINLLDGDVGGVELLVRGSE